MGTGGSKSEYEARLAVDFGKFSKNTSSGTLIDLRSDSFLALAPKKKVADPSLVCAQFTEEFGEEIDENVDQHPKYIEFEELCEQILDEGWSVESLHYFEQEIVRARSIRARLEEMYLSSDEWTLQTAVADILLHRGVNLYLDALLCLKAGLDNSVEAVEEGLRSLGDGVFYLIAVERWRTHCG